MKYSVGFKALATFTGITTFIGLGLTGASIGFAVHSIHTGAATLLPVMANGVSSQVVLTITGTSTLAAGLMAAVILAFSKTTNADKGKTRLNGDAIGLGIAAIIVTTAMVLGLGYGVGHLVLTPAIASSYSGFTLLGIDAACGAGLAAAIPLLCTIGVLFQSGKLKKGGAICIGTTIGALITGAGSILAGTALASLVGAIGSEAITIECMTAVVLAIIPASVFSFSTDRGAPSTTP